MARLSPRRRFKTVCRVEDSDEIRVKDLLYLIILVEAKMDDFRAMWVAIVRSDEDYLERDEVMGWAQKSVDIASLLVEEARLKMQRRRITEGMTDGDTSKYELTGIFLGDPMDVRRCKGASRHPPHPSERRSCRYHSKMQDFNEHNEHDEHPITLGRTRRLGRNAATARTYGMYALLAV